MSHPWPELKWWDSGERQVVEEKIDDLEKHGVVCNPEKRSLYAALRAIPLGDVRVAIVGQDPYPTKGVANGLAFSAPGTNPGSYPHTLRIIFQEYCSDLHYDMPRSGDLEQWSKRGVLLWNAIPSVQAGRPSSNDWPEWDTLTREVFQRLSDKGIVFALLGGVAARHADVIDLERNRVLRTSHPSPRGIRASKSPFTGSRVFTTINAKLRELDLEPINWRLDDDPFGGSNLQTPAVGGTHVLPNVTGANLGGLKKQGVSPNIYTSLAF